MTIPVLRTLADGVVRLSPFAELALPNTSAAIQKAFGITGRRPAGALAKAGTPVRPTDPPVLFPRVSS